jgi:CheR methyltransferase, SAM binding domain
MLRCYANGHTGTTAFFRNRPLLTELMGLLADAGTYPVRVLFHACSVGAEPYSLALWWHHHAPPGAAEALAIDATDIEPDFLETARRGVYPLRVLDGLSAREQSWFANHAEGVQVPAHARRMVRVLPPMSFAAPALTGCYDAVCIMNALTYVTAGEQRRAIVAAGRHARRVVALTAFHPDTIAADVAVAGLVPWSGQQRAIHEAWGDRLVDGPVTPESPYYSFQLPRRYPDAPDAAARYGALFVPASSANQAR